MADDPVVSVVMGVFNEAPHLANTLDSLLAQDYPHWEAVVVDDGSQDGSREILAHYQQQDERIQPLFLEHNGGLTRALNRGLGIARGRYIARLDGDDLCLPHRLKRQVALLEDRPDINLVGGAWLEVREGKERLVQPPTEPILLRWHALFANPFCHGSMLFRRLWQGEPLFYEPAFAVAQDYELWCRLMEKGGVAALSAPPLVRRCQRSTGISVRHKEEQYRLALTVVRANLQRIIPFHAFTMEETARLRTLATYPGRLLPEEVVDYAILLRLFRQFVLNYPPADRMLLGKVLAASLLTVMGRDNWSVVWKTGLWWQMVTTLPLPLLFSLPRRFLPQRTPSWGAGTRNMA
ncbi:MAG: glycosyltransferase family 2 protein [Magnetococcales bacterium]|nr:glycosyltransferase family 2 protein [Magnetococcales bacterium]NGZ28308.1 glycosyltransferase family 2 protein [Magnetococcales bacterium]